MIGPAPKPVKLWGRGRLTIPKEFRDTLRLDDAATLNVFAVGRCLVLTPKRLLRYWLAEDVERTMKSKRLTSSELLRALKEERRRYNRKTYPPR